MPKGKNTIRAESPAKQPIQSALLALPGQPLRGGDSGTAPEPVPGHVPRRRPGRGNEVSPTERRTIQLAKLTGPTVSQDELAARFGRSRDTIRRVLSGPDYEQLKAELDAATRAEARGVLADARTTAARAWVSSLEPAARRGDHRPASALLLHTGTIDPVSQQGVGPQVVVHIGQVSINDATRPLREVIIEGQAIPSERDDDPE